MRIRTAVLVCVATAAVMTAQPVINPVGAGNAGSMIARGLPGAGIAQGARIAIMGKDLGPAEAATRGFPLSAEPLGGVSIKVEVGGSTVDAWVVLASASRLEAVLPSSTPVGSARITVSYQDRSATTPAEVVKARFGISTRTNTGIGAARAASEDSIDITPLAAAKPGQRIVLTGTGLGPVEGDEAAGPVSGELTAVLEVRIGGKVVNVISKGRSEAPGMDRVVVEVPEVSGCNVPVVASTDGVYTNFATIAVGADGRCSDETGFSQADFDRFPTSGTARTGSISLSRTSMAVEGFSLTSHAASGGFQEWTASDLFQTGGLDVLPSLGSCFVLRFAATEEAFPEFRWKNLDAGPALTITGPRGSRPMPKRDGVYSADLGQSLPIPGAPSTAFLDPGEYTVTGPGGADVGAFSAKIRIGAAIDWTNRQALGTVPRGQDLQVTWTGGTDSEYVWVNGTSATEQAAQAVTFVCLERATAGRLTVPSYVLSQLPAGDGVLMVFSAPFRAGNAFQASGIDAGYITATSGSGRTSSFR
ncbi:MAG: hypothetical protein JNL98_13575 [Bryobacterales bacterium]|nr:hypothetical protein [Bryobacterales bacterium]